jgi:hypothetical protein
MPIQRWQWNLSKVQWDPYGYNMGSPLAGAAVNSRDSLVPEYFYPTALNTGHMTPIEQMTVVSGNVTWNAEHDNMVITKTRFTGRLRLNCVNLTFVDCYFEGSIVDSTQSLCVLADGTRCANLWFKDCTFKPANPTHDSHCFMAYHFRATRCEFTGGVDGISPVVPLDINSRLDSIVEGCWVHDLAFFSPDNRHSSNDTHNDCIQWGSGKGLSIVGCRLEGFADPNIGDATKPSVDSGTTHVSGNKSYPSLAVGSGLIPVLAAAPAGHSYAPLGDLTFTGNWVSGGSVGVNMGAGHDGTTNQTFFTSGDALIARNKFGWDWLNGQDYIVNHYGTTGTQNFTYQDNYRWGGSHAKWLHGDALTGLTHNEDIIDPWDISVPFTILK